MNIKELVKETSKRTGHTQKDISTIIESMLNVIKDTVASGEDVKIKDFGSFHKRTYFGRITRLPTGELVEVPDFSNIKFIAREDFKRRVRESD